MIPFARLLRYGNEITHEGILDIDFSTTSVGSTAIYDSSGTAFELKRGTVGVVEYDAEINSNVYNCANNIGYVRSVSPLLSTKLDLSQYSAFEIEYRIKSVGTGLQVFFETGGFNSRRIYGIGNSFNQYNTAFNQLFIDWGTSYGRCLPPWTNTFEWDTYTFTFRRGISITMTSAKYGSTELPWYDVVSDSRQYFSLFGSYVDGDNGQDPYSFKGKIQYIRIREIV